MSETRTRVKVSRGVIFTSAHVSLALLSLTKNEGLLVVYSYQSGISLRDGPLENLSGGGGAGEVQKKIFAEGKIK